MVSLIELTLHFIPLRKQVKRLSLFTNMATGPTPFSIGNSMGVFQQPTHVVPPTGGDPPGLRHGSGAASLASRTNAAQYGGPMGLTPASSPSPTTGRRRNGRGMDDEPRAQSNPTGHARAGIQTAIEPKEVTDGLSDRLEDVFRRLIALEELQLRQANAISENASTATMNERARIVVP